MKLWKITPIDPWIGGCALVAAESLSRAYYLLVLHDERLDSQWVSLTGGEVEEISYLGNEEKVIFEEIYIEDTI